MAEKIIVLLGKYQEEFANVVPHDLNARNVVVFNLTSNNPILKEIDIDDEESFTNFIFDALDTAKSPVGIGRYSEDRIIYKRSKVFNDGKEKSRSLHLGIDIWAVAGTPVFAPLEGKVHSFKNNYSHGDYGPTLILEHNLEGVIFYTLYGHLSLPSIANKTIGQKIERGEQIASLGDYKVNVHWPPHLHFQLITDMGEKFGDFPGVAIPGQKEKFLKLCPDPNYILGIQQLM